ncbi:MAG TPA: DUF3240 domain-containing protein [Myxococcales bacterium]|nr:DUF3240 domain-containing protein [Myxococcales bacterium]HIM00411.1 DUF3240 domain-containing protein [Myxococcales bacterium]
MNECLLTLIATPELEERLVDWLLEANHEGFTTFRCQGHGVHADRLSTAEQVAGRQRQIAFWLQLPEGEAEVVIRGLSNSFGGAGLHFWITPVLAGGPIGSPASGETTA